MGLTPSPKTHRVTYEAHLIVLDVPGRVATTCQEVSLPSLRWTCVADV